MGKGRDPETVFKITEIKFRDIQRVNGPLRGGPTFWNPSDID